MFNETRGNPLAVLWVTALVVVFLSAVPSSPGPAYSGSTGPLVGTWQVVIRRQSTTQFVYVPYKIVVRKTASAYRICLPEGPLPYNVEIIVDSVSAGQVYHGSCTDFEGAVIEIKPPTLSGPAPLVEIGEIIKIQGTYDHVR